MTPGLLEFVATIDIHINPEITGGLTWHGFFTAVGIALGVWLALRYARRAGIPEDDGMTVALVGVPSGIVGARALWVFEHTGEIDNVGDVFALTDGGISIYGAMIGGTLGAFLYVVFFRPNFPRWMALDAAAPGMILGQAVGRIGDFINGEHFARASDLPWAFRYTHPETDGPWSVVTDGVIPDSELWHRGNRAIGDEAIPVHPVAGGYEPILDFLLLGGLILMWATGRVRHGWVFVTYVLVYAAIRGLLALLRSDEADVVGALSVPQLIAILTGIAAAAMAYYLIKNPQPKVGSVRFSDRDDRDSARESGRARRAERRQVRLRQPGQSRGRRRRR